MSIEDLNELIERNISRGTEIFILQGASCHKIHLAEEMLGITFPEFYKKYLENYGTIEIYGKSFGGIGEEDVGSDGDVVAFTKYFREEFQLPERYIAIDFPDGDVFYVSIPVNRILIENLLLF